MLYRGRAPRQERLTILRAATHETELGDHDFCLSRSHYTDTDPTCRERAATAGIEISVERLSLTCRNLIICGFSGFNRLSTEVAYFLPPPHIHA